jgi:hypothetical protein
MSRSPMVTRWLALFIDCEEFITDLFVIPLDGHEMVLMVHWLCTLGPIL